MALSSRLALAGLLGAALALPALAQQPAPPPAWAQGRPDSLAASTLAPHAPRLTATPAERIPLDQIRGRAGAVISSPAGRSGPVKPFQKVRVVF